MEKIQELEEKYHVRILTRDNIDDEINAWAESMKEDYNFLELVDMIRDEEYADYNNEYGYFLMEDGYFYPHVGESFETIEELEEYLDEFYATFTNN